MGNDLIITLARKEIVKMENAEEKEKVESILNDELYLIEEIENIIQTIQNNIDDNIMTNDLDQYQKQNIDNVYLLSCTAKRLVKQLKETKNKNYKTVLEMI